MIDFDEKTKYKIEYTSKFKKQLKRLVNLEELDLKYKNHNLVNNKIYNNCKECHIRPD